ncbi:MAG: metal ABC transporter ATP-binding protein [Candidatus Rokubacteria bacterium]|nr:metal ABC transporter ATP-binding protein [Candidatus Rokubacteria bacterium]
MTPLVELRGVRVNYEAVPVLEDITLTVERGDFLGIIGPNGGGKTTLLKIMLGLLVPSSGEVRLFGEPIERFDAWHRLGYVPQKVVFDPTVPATVEEVVTTALAARAGLFRRLSRAERQRAMDALILAGMDRHRAGRIGHLSVGQQQRVLIARALVTGPEILILDEPTGGVDPEAQASFYALLHTLNREQGVTLVLVSHELAVVARAVTKVACLNRRMVFHGGPAEALTDAGLAALYGSSARLVSHLH